MKNEALKFLKKICKNRVKVTKKMVIFFLMTGGLLLSQVNFSESVDETKPATIKDLKNYDYPNSLHFVSVHYSKEDVKEYKDYYKYLDLLKKRLEYLKEIALEKVNGNNDKVKKLKEEEKKLKTSMEKLKGGNELISQKLSDKFEKNFKIPKNKDIKEINNEYAKRMNEINKLSSNFNNLGIDFAHSIAIGKGAEIKGENGIAIGVDTLSGKDSISLGKATNASGEGNIAIGRDATLFSKTFKGKIGQQIARILNDPNTIVKFENDGDVEYKKTIVIGDGTKSSGNSNIAIGDNAVAMKKRLTLISSDAGGTLSNKNGAEIDARNWNDIAKQFYNPGNQDKRSYTFEVKPVENAIALGKNASAFADNVIAIGKGAISGFESAVSIGENADTEGKNSVAIGKNSIIFGESSVAIGEGSRTGKIKYVLKTIEGKDKEEKTEKFDTLEAAKQELEKKKDLSKIYRIEVGGEKSENSVAIGKGSAVEHSGSVAIGADSLAVESNGKSAFTEVDHTSGETVSFGNSNKKRRLTNVADGKDSSDAVTVAQLQKAIADNKGGSGGSAVDSKLKLSDGKETKDLSLKDDTLEIANGTNTTVSLSKDDANKKATFKVNVKGNLTGITSIAKENGSKLTLNDDNITVNKKITGLEDGSISANSKDAINGGQLNKELDKKINKDDLDVTGDGKYITVTNEDNTKKKYKVAFNESELTNTITNNINNYKFSENKSIQDMLDKKANKDASNLDDKDVENWQNKLGNGSVAKDDTKLVKGGTVFTYVDNTINTIKQELSTKTTEDLAKKLNVDADNLSNTGKTNLTNSLGTGAITDNNTELVKGGVVKTYVDNKLKDKLSSDDVNVTGDEYITVTTNKNKYALSLNKEKLGANIDISNNNTITNINTELGKKANLDASNLKEQDIKDWQTKLGNGSVTDNNTGLVNGGTVKTYVDSKIENSTNTINTTLDTKLNKDDLEVTGDDKYIDVTNEDATKKKYKVAFKESALKQLVNDTDITNNTYLKTKLDTKADKDAGNLDEKDIENWQNKLGNGTVTDGDTKLVKGGTVFTYVNNTINTIKQEISTKATEDLAKKLDIDANNLNDTGVTNLTKALGKGEIKDNDNKLVTGGTVKAYITEEINDINTKVSGKLSSSDVDVKGDDYIKVNKGVDKPNHYSLVFNKEQLATDLDLSKNTKLNEQFGKYALLDGSNLENINLNVWQAKLGDGAIASGNTGLVKGGDVFTYVNNIKQELNNRATQDLSNKLDKGGTNLDKDSLDKLTNKLSEESNLTTPTNRLVTDTKVSEVLKGKLDIDADNLSDKGVTNLTTKLGTGVVKENNTGLITGGKVYEVKKELNNSISTNTQNITDLNNKYTTLNNQVTTNTNDISKLKTDVEDLKNTKQDITKINNKLGDIDKSITNINTTLDGKLDKTDLSIKGDNYIKVDKDDKFNYKLSLNKDTLAKDLDLTNNNSINNMFTTKLGDINTNIGDLTTKVETNTNNINSLTTKVDGNTNKISDLTTKVDTNTKDINTLKQDMTKKLNVDADNLTTKGETNLINKLSKDSNIAKPKDRLVTDKQVNKYLSRYNDALGVVDKKSTVALEKSELALGGVANAVAMANLVQVNSYSDYRHNLSAAYGYYGGSHALAVGFSGTNEERNFVYKLSGSVNNKGNLAFGVGAGVMLGDKDERLTTEYSTKLKTVEKDLVEANKKIKEYEERQKATDIKVKELERKLNQILNKH